MDDFHMAEKVRLGTPFDVQDAMAIATKIVDPDGKGLNDHWQKVGFSLLTAVILHVLYAEPDKTLRGVAAFLDNPDFDKMRNTEHDPNGLYGWQQVCGKRCHRRMYNVKAHPVIALSAKEMAEKPANERSGVISTARHYLERFAA